MNHLERNIYAQMGLWCLFCTCEVQADTVCIFCKQVLFIAWVKFYHPAWCYCREILPKTLVCDRFQDPFLTDHVIQTCWGYAGLSSYIKYYYNFFYLSAMSLHNLCPYIICNSFYTEQLHFICFPTFRWESLEQSINSYMNIYTHTSSVEGWHPNNGIFLNN